MQKLAILTKYLTRIVNSGLDMVFPLECVSCGVTLDTVESAGVFCDDCRKILPDQPPVVCVRCKALIPDPGLMLADGCYCCSRDDAPLLGIITIGPYHEDQQLSGMILAMKHGGKTWYAREFGFRLAQKIRRYYPDSRWDAVVAVPLHRTRRWKRGYNQAALVAGELASHLDVPSFEWLLRRHRRTSPQSGGRDQRRSNIEGAFESGGICSNARIILVDDVVTTGATTAECAMTLRRAGAAEVLVAACAWVPVRRSA